MKALLDSAGRISLPDSVQAQLGVKPGDELALEEELGRWFIKPVTAPGTPHELVIPQRVSDDDLNWQELSYDPVPLKRAGQVAVRIAHRGKLQTTVPAADEG
jgi:bifunctional DNA-binding transcriptional regulator/antitoxin component of YhaV-PrlF toxin-antitoxin module